MIVRLRGVGLTTDPVVINTKLRHAIHRSRLLADSGTELVCTLIEWFVGVAVDG